MGYYTPSKEAIEWLKKKFPKGTRVELDCMNDPYTKLISGDKGTVKCVDDIGTIHVNWDRGSSLGLIYTEDDFHIIEE